MRNELSDLSELGYLEQPHTSAGRIPSPKGYRLYVDQLMERQRLSIQETEQINRALTLKLEELERFIAQAGRAVSALVRYPAYAAAAGRSALNVSRFELLAVDGQSCILVMLLTDNRVKSQLLRLQLKVEPPQLTELSGLLNRHFTGACPREMSRRCMAAAQDTPPQQFLLLSQIVTAAVETLQEALQPAFVTAGADRLLRLPEFQDTEKAHDLMRFLADGQAHLPVPDEGPMKILIGPENVTEALKDASVVVASYDIGDDMRGLIGVVGPTRMDYAAVAARLTGFAEGLGRLLGKQEGSPLKEDTTT